MTALGYVVLSEEHPPESMVSDLDKAESRGFDFGMVSDHFHPWTTT